MKEFFFHFWYNLLSRNKIKTQWDWDIYIFMTRNGYSYRFVRPIWWRVRLIGWTIETDLCFVVIITEFQGHRLHIHSATGCYCMCFLLVLRWWQPSVSIHLSLMFHMAPVLLNQRSLSLCSCVFSRGICCCCILGIVSAIALCSV